eukprot:161647-Chlamydomonas_euryale.AAC.1
MLGFRRLCVCPLPCMLWPLHGRRRRILKVPIGGSVLARWQCLLGGTCLGAALLHPQRKKTINLLTLPVEGASKRTSKAAG